MIRRRLVVLLALGLTGCGSGTPGALPVGFANHTQHTNGDLWTIWKTAQQSLSRQIDLNPLQRTLYGSPPNTLPGDPLALQVMPRQLSVSSAPDVTSSVLLAAAGVNRPDPTGLIACPQPCNVQYAAAYSEYEPQITRYAASWEFQGDNFSLILQYEFENQIMAALGYNLRWR